MSSDLIPIERKDGVTLYGRIIGKGGKLGQYEVHSDWSRFDGNVYCDYKAAETRMNALIGVKTGNQ